MQKNEEQEELELSDEQYHDYCRLQNRIVLCDDLFCVMLVLGITLITYQTGNWKLMWFYILPVFAFLAV